MTRFVLCCVVLLTASWGTIAEMETPMPAFATPNPEFSPVPIWWWSGDPITREGISAQLERMAAGGIYNAIILNLAPSGPLYGSAPDEPPFLTEEWWDLFEFALEEAKKNGIRLWFYDQLGFSGAGLQARVVRDHPEFRGVVLQRAFQDVEGPTEVELRIPASGAFVAAFTAELAPAEARPQEAQWVWAPNTPEGKLKRWFRRAFTLDTAPAKARINISCDNGYVLYLNGEKLGEESIYGEEGWGRAERFDAAPYLRAGDNVIAVEAENLGGIGGLILELIWETPDGARRAIVSDGAFRAAEAPEEGWTRPGFHDGGWNAAEVIGPVAQSPWPTAQGLETTADTGLGVPLRNVRRVSATPQDGVVRVQAPDGPQRVQVFFTTPGGFDYQNPAAGAALLDIVHGKMERRFLHELGTGIAGSFQDEFPAVPRYSQRMPEEFLKRKGYDLIERLPALYDDVTDRFGAADGPGTVQIRCDANDVAAALNEEAFFIPLYEWHERFGMLCGYDQTVRNADPIRGEQYYVDYFRTQRHYSAPGNDMDGDCKPHQSIADLYSRPRVWMEAFHSSGWGQTLEEIAVLLHPWLANGATLFDPHAIYYSIHGSFYEWAPPDTGWRQPYFAHYRMLADYVSRLCEVLSKGRHVVRVGVLHPAKTVHAYTGFGNPGGPAQQASQAYWAVQRALQQARIDYIIVDEDSLARMTSQDGALALDGLRLESMVLPATHVLGAESVRQLYAFAAGGGQVIMIGPGPEYTANHETDEATFAAFAERLIARSIRLDDTARVAETVEGKVGRDTKEPVISLRRRIGDRDFFFLLSDDGTPATSQARFEINKRALYETAAARGQRMAVTFAVDGVPEFWDALSGKTRPLLNYRRDGNATRVEIDLATTPAPLIAFRAADSADPIAVESDLDVLDLTRDGDAVRVEAAARLDAGDSEHRVRVAYGDKSFVGRCRAAGTSRTAVEGPLTCRLEPTCDNWDGSFAWPPSDGPIPVEARAFRFKPETPGSEAAAWARPDLDDGDWPVVIASFGPRALMSPAMTAKVGRDFEAIAGIPDNLGELRPAVYSLRLGINEDPVFSSALGGKGRIPEEFIDFGDVVAGHVYVARATIIVPEDVTGKGLDAVLRIGGAAKKRAFLNGVEVTFGEPVNARARHGAVKLRPGPNRLDLLAAREANGRLRLFYHFLAQGTEVHAPEWIWNAERSRSEKTRFVKRFHVDGKVKSAAMVVALGDLHQIRVNG
ncbi:MAG TPA: glycosyl hydrolase, partial [Candidatus Hydrogenedentes bacterium]|nr:glycosyl hydrolase [Candidatus Hydrogenedentota bacterium]